MQNGMETLITSIPPQWVNLKIYLQRAQDFHESDPVVAYFLLTHALHLAIKQRSKAKDEAKLNEKKEEDAYLNLLLTCIDGEKKRLSKQLEGIDGRTVLTKVALELFSRAETREQAGQCDVPLIRLFFTSALLFEATAQFTKDSKMDAVAAERCRYAKYMGSTLKKKLDQNCSSPTIASSGNLSVLPLSNSATSPHKAFVNSSLEGKNVTPVGQQQQSRPNRSPTTTPSASSPNKSFENEAVSSPTTKCTDETVPKRKEDKHPEKLISAASSSEISDPSAPIPGGNGRVSLNDLIKAQKHAKNSVSALQFLDYAEAVRELRKALQILE